MKRIMLAYKELLGILWQNSPHIVVLAFVCAVIMGFSEPIAIWVNGQVFNQGLDVAAGNLSFAQYTPTLVMFVVLSLLPIFTGSLLVNGYIEQRSQLILRTAYKGKMLQKLKKLRYEHIESEESMETISKAYNRTENSARHMFPMYVVNTIRSVIASAGTLYLFATVRWWLLLTILVPFIIETYVIKEFQYNIYKEIEKYWKDERRTGVLGDILKARDFVKENRIFQSAKYLIEVYRQRMNARNRQYEQFYFKHLRANFFGQYITKIAQVVNAVILLWLYSRGELSVGLLITLTLAVFSSLYSLLWGSMHFFQISGMHIQNYENYDKYFALSEDDEGDLNDLPEDFSIEFDNVHFKYPGTDKPILQGLTLKIRHGEKVSIVGENGEGKTTMIKLLLGLFTPDSGEIRVGGRPLSAYTQSARTRLFGPVFQDFNKYSISLAENVGVGDIAKAGDKAALEAAMHRAKVDAFTDKLPDGAETLLGRDFEGGVDISGGQWQRIAIARAFMGEKPILILDEPTSQLDPMAESQIYQEFSDMAGGKTAIFITHRLGSTMITDRIHVISGGRVTQSGTHNELMRQGGLYADMFNAQKQWYHKNGEGGGNQCLATAQAP